MRKFELLIKSDVDYRVEDLEQIISWAFSDVYHPYDAEKVVLKEISSDVKEIELVEG